MWCIINTTRKKKSSISFGARSLSLSIWVCSRGLAYVNIYLCTRGSGRFYMVLFICGTISILEYFYSSKIICVKMYSDASKKQFSLAPHFIGEKRKRHCFIFCSCDVYKLRYSVRIARYSHTHTWLMGPLKVGSAPCGENRWRGVYM